LINIALAMIVFMVEVETKYEVFRRDGRQFIITILSEGMLAMTMVAMPIRLWTGNLTKAYSMVP